MRGLPSIPTLVLLGFATLLPASARADVVVTLCGSDAQPGAGMNLVTAIAAGGNIRFACAGATIRITGRLPVSHDVQIDGERSVTLDAAQATEMFSAGDNVTVILKGLTLRGGRGSFRHHDLPTLGSVIHSAGNVVIAESRIEQSASPVSVSGRLTVRDTVFTDNRGTAIYGTHPSLSHVQIGSTDGPAIISRGGEVLIEDTEIFGSGTAQFDACTGVVIRNTDFTNNHASDEGDGGAVSTNCATRIERSRFVNNRARNGGAVFINQAATAVEMNAVTFTGNAATGNGGAIGFAFNDGVPRTLSIHHGVFKQNTAAEGGAIDLNETIQNDTRLTGSALLFASNAATKTGGGISGTNASVRLSRAIFTDNTAGQGGGGIYMFKLAPRAADLFANALLVRNVARQGAAYAGSNADFVNSTMAANQGQAVSFVFVSPVTEPWRRITLKNTVLSANVPDNCQRNGLFAAIEDRGNNLQFPDGGCGDTVMVKDPMLDTMFIPLVSSPALGGGDTAICRATPIDARDVFGQRRPQGRDCTIGAIEGDIEHLVNRRLARDPEHRTGPQ